MTLTRACGYTFYSISFNKTLFRYYTYIDRSINCCFSFSKSSHSKKRTALTVYACAVHMVEVIRWNESIVYNFHYMSDNCILKTYFLKAYISIYIYIIQVWSTYASFCMKHVFLSVNYWLVWWQRDEVVYKWPT